MLTRDRNNSLIRNSNLTELNLRSVSWITKDKISSDKSVSHSLKTPKRFFVTQNCYYGRGKMIMGGREMGKRGGGTINLNVVSSRLGRNQSAKAFVGRPIVGYRAERRWQMSAGTEDILFTFYTAAPFVGKGYDRWEISRWWIWLD